MGWFTAHIFVTIIICITMSVSGFGLGTWQYWAILIGVALANSFGRAQGEEKK